VRNVEKYNMGQAKFINFCLLKGVDVKPRKKMKKKFFLVGIIAIMSLGALVSCSDDDNGGSAKSCNCTEYSDGENVGSNTINPSSFGAANCSDLAIKLRAEALKSGYNNNFSCN
jgi:hypothetical protein